MCSTFAIATFTASPATKKSSATRATPATSASPALTFATATIATIVATIATATGAISTPALALTAAFAVAATTATLCVAFVAWLSFASAGGVHQRLLWADMRWLPRVRLQLRTVGGFWLRLHRLLVRCRANARNAPPRAHSATPHALTTTAPSPSCALTTIALLCTNMLWCTL